MKPKDCANSNCTKIIYVEDYKLPLPIQCGECIEKRQIIND